MTRLIKLLAAIAPIMLSIGCQQAPDWIVPQSELRTIEPVEFQPSTQPTTGPSTSFSTQTWPAERVLSLNEARELTLRNNLDIQVALVDPSIAREQYSEAQAAFDAIFTTRADLTTLDQPTGSIQPETGLPISSQVKSWDVTPGIRLPLRTGGTIEISAPISRQEVNNNVDDFASEPDYESDLTISVTQPLLRGAGRDATEQQIRIASFEQQRSEAQTRLIVIRTIAAVDRAYWRMAAARDALTVRVAQVRLADIQLERAERQVRAGTAAEVEVVRAEAGLADARETVIVAEQDLRERQRELKRIINDSSMPVESPTIVIPDEIPVELALDVNPDELLQRAINQRAELLDAELQILEQSANIAAAKNALLPLVSLEYQFNVNGLGGDFSEAVDVETDFDFLDHRIGLQVEIPLGNRAARAAYRQSLLRRLQLFSTREGQAQTIRKEVLDSIDSLTSTFQRVEAARERVRVNQRLVDAEVRQFDQGLRTSTDVLNAQTNLADALTALVSAQTEYQIAQVDVAFSTGTTLGRARVSWSPRDLDESNGKQ